MEKHHVHLTCLYTYQRIMEIIGRLRYQDVGRRTGRPHEMMRPYICHNLCTGVYLDVQLLFEASRVLETAELVMVISVTY